MSRYALSYQYRHEMEYSIKALPLMVEIDDELAPWAEVVEIVKQSGPECNRARFRIQSEGGEWRGRLEELARAAAPGQTVTIWMPLPLGWNTMGKKGWPLFHGVICGGAGNLRGTQEAVEMEACDAIVYRDQRTINGIRVCGEDHGMVWGEGMDAVFNPNGIGNRSEARIQRNGQEYFIFEQDSEHTEAWRYEDAIQYLAEEYLGRGILTKGGMASIRSYSANQTLSDRRVTGRTALEAMQRLCEEAGLIFTMEYAVGAGDRVIEALRFCGKGCGRRVRLRHQKAGESLDIRRTNVAECKAAVQNIQPKEGEENPWRDSQQMDLAGEAVIPWLAAEILPGDVVAEVKGRGLSFEEMRHKRGSLPQVKKVILKPQRWETVVQFGE